MAEQKTKDGRLTSADLASYGIPIEQPALLKELELNDDKKEQNDETKHKRSYRGKAPRSEGQG
jgi:hypothetical protein